MSYNLYTENTVVDTKNTQELSHSMSTRHTSMIAIGGIIGAGLFVGSANAINLAGPSVLLSYGIAGILVLCICQTLGELAASWPGKGSFAHYTALAYGTVFGEVIGWLYWWFWILIIIIESVAGGRILSEFLPGKQWLWTLVLILTLGIVNLLSANLYGESEFLLSVLKITIITIFIIIGFLAIIGVIPHAPHGISHLWSEGLFPRGISGTAAAFLIAVTSYCGCESISLITAESNDPLGNLKRSLRSVLWRVLTFYIGTLFIATALVRYDAIDSRGTFITVLDSIGIKHSGIIVNGVVLIAVISCLNSSYFIASRMLYNLACTKSAPTLFSRVNARSVPINTICFSGLISLIGVFGSYYFPSKIFGDLFASSGTTMLLIYIAVALSQIKLRKKAIENRENPNSLAIKMWLHPWLALWVIFVIIGSIIWMLTIDSQRTPVLTALIIAVVLSISIFIKNQLSVNTHTRQTRISHTLNK